MISLPFLRQLINYLQTSLVPNRSFLRLRLADVSLYFCGLSWISLWTTIIDSFFLQKNIPIVIWFILHFIFIAIAVLLYLLFMAYLTKGFVRLLLPRPWAYRQTFPYTVATNLWSFPLGMLLYQLGYQRSGIGLLVIGHFVYTLVPLWIARSSKPRPSHRA
ncbi:hypothetical protein RIF24_04715 [Exiguobacterium acetylicum]|uniref:hypothetical protein n=1 Tax=Exiguobacterium acetylicum TaxID=41170 RepID=UPI0022740887|nr:hypothetical protein [Exiguobacterium sp. SL14]MCY1691917.1 hypothetical protein [Exiguobacterium sp. SL14]